MRKVRTFQNDAFLDFTSDRQNYVCLARLRKWTILHFKRKVHSFGNVPWGVKVQQLETGNVGILSKSAIFGSESAIIGVKVQ